MGKLRHFYLKRRKTAVASAAILALLAGGVGYKRYKAADKAPAGFESPSQGDIEVHFKDSGDIAPKVFVDVASKVSGRVIELKVKEGQAVQKGQALAVVQPGRTESERYVPSTVGAPLAGTVMRYVPAADNNYNVKFPRIGDYLTGLFDSQSPTYLMTVADLSRLVVNMQINEMDVLKLSAGLPVTVTVDALDGQVFPARVSLIAPQAEKNNAGLKVFKVEVELDRAEPRLKPGMTARVDALLEKRKGVLRVPLSAVFEESGKTYVYVDKKKGNPDRIRVELGLRSEMDAELLDPKTLSGKDRLLTEKPAEKPKKS
ncbi:MAG: efflux RND transporter periplasmic adaptor subunit [Elusimicrobia bacterium]|nr:efflux RND transporter periplasmic adaptor subunit [Elusimicrobiota bacterium]